MNSKALTITALTMLVLALSAGPALALPAPMSAEELQKNSDVVATVRVLAVTCVGETGKDKLTTYQAWLQVVKVNKGDVKPDETLIVQWHDIPKNLIGPWKVDYFPGEEVETHLHWNKDTRAYETTWWNAKGKPIQAAETDKLPGKAGQIITAKKLK